MTSATYLSLASDFPPASYEDWHKLVEGVLKEASFDRLTSKTYDGLTIEPIYRRANEAAPVVGRAPAAPWQIMQRVDHPDPAKANAIALDDLKNGATGLQLEFAGAPGARGFGVVDATAETLNRLFEGVIFDAGISIALTPVRDRDIVGERLAALIESKAIDPARVDLRFDYQPLSSMAVRGVAPSR